MWRRRICAVVERGSGAVCGCLKRQNRVQPIHIVPLEVLTLETHPNRFLRVLHYLPEKSKRRRTKPTVRGADGGGSSVDLTPASKGESDATKDKCAALRIPSPVLVLDDSISLESENVQCTEYSPRLDLSFSDFESVDFVSGLYYFDNFKLSESHLSKFDRLTELYAQVIVKAALAEILNRKKCKKEPFEIKPTCGDSLECFDCYCLKDSGLGSSPNVHNKKQCYAQSPIKSQVFGIINPMFSDSSLELEETVMMSTNEDHECKTDFSDFLARVTEMGDENNYSELNIGNGCSLNPDSESSGFNLLQDNLHSDDINFMPIIKKHSRATRSNSRGDGQPTAADEVEVELQSQVDDNVSQPESSMHSTWGSSMAESLRFIQNLMKTTRTKPVMFFIHGIGGSADVWQSQLKYFRRKGYETIAMDLIGHGFSSAPRRSKAYTFRRILMDVIVVFDHFCKDTNVIIGHSYGSSFAAALARQRPQQVSQLVLLGGGGPVSLAPMSGLFTMPDCLISCIHPFIRYGLCREVLYTPSGRRATHVTTLDVPPYVLRHMMRGQKWPEGDVSFYRHISVPTLLVHGLRDPLVSLVEECEMERTIPRAFLELIPDAGHMMMLDAPEQLNSMLHRFLKRYAH